MDKRKNRINHIAGHIKFQFGEELISIMKNNIRRGFNVSTSELGLASYAEAMAMNAWFVDGDLISFHQWAKSSAKHSGESIEINGPGVFAYPLFLKMLWPMLSNDDLIFSRFIKFAEKKLGDENFNSREDHFLLLQFVHAANGNWTDIRKSCGNFLSDNYSSVSSKYILDYKLLNAMSINDWEGVKVALSEMVGASELRKNAKYESGYTEDLISTRAVIWCKLAWLHKIPVLIDSDFIPGEWLPWS